MATGPTHIQGNKLDCVFCNHTDIISNVTCTQPHWIFPTYHYLIDFEIKLHFDRAKPVKRIVYDYKNVGLRVRLNRVPFDIAISANLDINESWQTWKDLFLISVEGFVSRKTISDKNTPPWIDREVKYLIKKKYTALRRILPQRKENIRRLTQQIKDMIKRKHEDYLEKIKNYSRVPSFQSPTGIVCSQTMRY